MKTRIAIFLIAWLGAIASGCAQTCRASFYGSESGHVTASGERFNPAGFTAAHRSLRFGTRLRVRLGGRSVVVRITDRGPAAWTGRCLDLSRGAATVLAMIRAGTARVTIERLN